MYIEEKVVTFKALILAIFFMKSYTIIVEILSKHIIILQLWVKNVVFEQKVSSLKTTGLYRNKGNGYRKQSLKM